MIKACPFCNNTNYHLHESNHWTGQNNIVLSVSLIHCCDNNAVDSIRIVVKGKTEEEAIQLWNTRIN